MEVIIKENPEQATALAARIVRRQIQNKPSSVLGLATGSTPRPLYDKLIEFHKSEDLDFSQVRTFNLDEYVGLSPENPGSYAYYMKENFFKHVNMPLENTHIPNGMSESVPAECTVYENKIISSGGIDLQILGVGTDGHIGFNEPCSSLASRTRLKTLTPQTRRDNARFFENEDQVPHHVITMGIGTIMEARHIVVLAFGERKAKAVAEAVEGPVTAMVPASVLHMHSHVTFIIDEGASVMLRKKDYFNWVYENKPDWQRL